ncbi:MAG: LysM peptidoglycan-binding domain-containing protein [Lentisphaeria bacterium]|nr:LysM peptidoglycan-binding domain-containing protein [Lentisphaeria bacterium]
MKKMRFIFLIFVSAVLCSVPVSCSKDYTGKEKTHPVFVKAGTAQNSGDYAEAARLYEEFLLVAPKSAETHMRLAALYGDNLDSPLKAIYHYEKVIELRPDDTANNENIRSFISASRRKLFEMLKKEYVDEEQETAVKLELAKNQELVRKYREHIAEIRRRWTVQVEKWRAYVKEVERRNSSRAAATPAGKNTAAKTPSRSAVKKDAVKKDKDTVKKDTVKKAPAKAEVKTSAAKTKTAPENKSVSNEKNAARLEVLGKHTVKKGETLHSISRKYYGSSRYYKLIAEANKGKLPANLGVRIGQVLVIPRKPAK